MAAVSQTQAVGLAAQSFAQAAEGKSPVGANRTQALGVTTFLVGFTALSGAIYSGRILLYLAAVGLVALSMWLFRKCKPWETQGN